MPRRKNDFYPTPTELTRALIDHMRWQRDKYSFYEPCNGKGAISSVLRPMSLGESQVYTADIDEEMPANYYLDARVGWPFHDGVKLTFDWIVTNPPFNGAYQIVENLVNNRDNINCGFALLLRLSFLEPTNDRGEFLKHCPPSDLIILPRTSFTEDGKADSVTCAWMVWEWGKASQRVKVYTKEDLKKFRPQPTQPERQSNDQKKIIIMPPFTDEQIEEIKKKAQDQILNPNQKELSYDKSEYEKRLAKLDEEWKRRLNKTEYKPYPTDNT